MAKKCVPVILKDGELIHEFLTLIANFVFLQVVFEGVVGNGYQGDIAIDDISMTQGNCPLPGKLS